MFFRQSYSTAQDFTTQHFLSFFLCHSIFHRFNIVSKNTEYSEYLNVLCFQYGLHIPLSHAGGKVGNIEKEEVKQEIAKAEIVWWIQMSQWSWRPSLLGKLQTSLLPLRLYTFSSLIYGHNSSFSCHGYRMFHLCQHQSHNKLYVSAPVPRYVAPFFGPNLLHQSSVRVLSIIRPMKLSQWALACIMTFFTKESVALSCYQLL